MSTVPVKYNYLDLVDAPQSFSGIDILNGGSVARLLPTEVAFFRNTFRLNTAADETGLNVTGFDFVEEVIGLSDFWGRPVYTKIKITDPTYQIGHVYAFGDIAGSVIWSEDINRLQGQASDNKSVGDTHTTQISAIEKEMDEMPKNILAMEFETDSNGVVAYKDADQDTPVDGTGGTPVALSFGRSDTLPLIGTWSGLITKTTASARGEGISKDILIPRGKTVATQIVEFSYETDGSYADGDVGVFLYDKTNNSLIPLSVQEVPASYGKPAIFKAAYIPSTSNLYRLIFHVRTTNASAWTFKVDDVEVSDESVAVGAAISRWKKFTPAVGFQNLPGSWTADSSWRRVGENIELFLSWSTSGAATGVIYLNGAALLAGLRLTKAGPDEYIPITALPGSAGFGMGVWQWSSNAFYGPNFQSAWEPSQPAVWTANNVIQIRCSIPIAQWTSNVNLASDFQEFAYNTSTTATDDATSFGYGIEGAMFQAFAPTGLSSINKRVRFKSIQQSDLIIVEVKLDGFGWLPTYERSLGLQENDAGTARYGVHSYQVSDTDVVVQFFSRQNKVPSNTWSAIANLANRRWRVRKVSNGNMAEVPPLVRAEYVGTAVTAPATAPVKFVNKVEDTHSAYSPSTGYFTAPMNGVYSITGILFAGGTVTANIRAIKNGALSRYIGSMPNLSIYGAFTSSFRLLAGETLGVTQDGATATSINDHLRIVIERIGG